MNNQDSMPCPEAHNSTVIFPEKTNLFKSQDSDFKIAIINLFKDLKDVNKFPTKDYKYTNVQLNEENHLR